MSWQAVGGPGGAVRVPVTLRTGPPVANLASMTSGRAVTVVTRPAVYEVTGLAGAEVVLAAQPGSGARPASSGHTSSSIVPRGPTSQLQLQTTTLLHCCCCCCCGGQWEHSQAVAHNYVSSDYLLLY